jgi:uncharacterized protein YjbI with pentapeptide repeats
MTEIKNIYGEVIFTSGSLNDTVKQAVEQAVEANVSLMEAALEGADLREANLRDAKLWWADLGGAKIQIGNRVFTLKEEGTDETA